MWIDFTKNIIPETPVLTPEDMVIYKRYLTDIGYTIKYDNITNTIRKGKTKGKKRFNRTPRKNRT
jgi:hypothetical protein